MSKEKRRENDKVPVIVEIRVKKSLKLEISPEIARGIKTTSFSLDENYKPVHMSPGRERASVIANDEKGIIIRGVIKESKIKELESKPIVIKVWRDTKLDFFGYPCPIPPCDCSNSPKGNLSDVATYLGVDQIWSDGIKGQGIIIGIVDSGINAIGRVQKPGQTAQIHNVIGGYPTNDWGTTSGGNAHGNMTATDALGIAPGTQLYDMRVFDPDSLELSASNVLAAYDWAIDQYKNNGKPQILSNSYGLYEVDEIPEVKDAATNPDHPVTQKVVEAINEGIIVLWAAGNCGATCPRPKCGKDDIGPGESIWGVAGHNLVMTVGAVNINGELAGYSSQGPAALDPIKPDFCSITHFAGYHSVDTGTSAATPVAAGVVALLKQADPSITQSQVKHLLMEAATDIGPIGWDQHSGAGIINAIGAYNRWRLYHGKFNGKLKIADDGIKQIGDKIKLPGEIVSYPEIRGLSRFRSTNTPFVLATPHHSMAWIRRNHISYTESYEEILSEYELAIARLQEQLNYLQSEYFQIKEEYNKRLRSRNTRI